MTEGLFRAVFWPKQANAERSSAHIFWGFEHWGADFISHGILERVTRFELVTSTLARLRSTS